MSQWPHDDTQSLIAFYGDPRSAGFTGNLVLVVPPWSMTYEGRRIRGVQVHRKCAASLKAVFDDIAAQVGHDWSQLPPGATKFSGSYNYRPVRGSSRLSCHAFGAAIDLDAEDNPMNTNGDQGDMSPIVVGAFKRQGWYWGGDFHSRQDPMHFQAANEASRVAELASDLNPVGTADAADMPPMVDGHSLAEEAEKPHASIEELPARPSSTIEEMGSALPPAVVEQVKSIGKSKIAWAAGGLGGTAATSAVTNDPETQTLLWRLAHNATFWLALVALGLAGYVIYCRWRDHGRGQLQ